jgi:hypothetical protein
MSTKRANARYVDRRERLSQRNHRQGYYGEGLPHLGGHGSSRRWRSMNLKASTAPLRRSVIFAPPSKRWQASWGKTPTICRKCYVHPEVLNSYMDGNLVLELKSKAESELPSDVQRQKPEDPAVLALLRGRLAKEAERPTSKKQREKAA